MRALLPTPHLRRDEPCSGGLISRCVLLVLVIVGVTLLAGCGSTSQSSFLPAPQHGRGDSAAAGARSLDFPNTTAGIHVGLAFDYQVRNVSTLARNVDYVWGGYFIDSKSPVDPKVQHGDVYLPFDTDAYPQSFARHSLSYWKAEHPDWIVYRCDRRTPAYYGSGSTNVPLDFSNPDVRAYQVREAGLAFRAGARGVGFDNYSFVNYADRCGVFRHGVWTPLGYPGSWQDNAKFDHDMISWLSDIRSRIRATFPNRTIGLNMDFRLVGPTHLRELIPYIDFVFNEAGFTSYGTKNATGSAWEQEVQALQYLNAEGKAFDVNGTVNAAHDADVTPQQINWVLANYLLVKGPHSYTYIYAGNKAGYTGSPSGYGTFYDRPQYHVPIGSPTANMTTFRGLAIRFYSGGLALVNSSDSDTRTIPLTAPYHDMFGRKYTSVTLAPASGLVLLAG